MITASAAAVIVSGCSTPKKSSRAIYAQLVQKSVRQLSSAGAETTRAESDAPESSLSEQERIEAEALLKRADEAYDKEKDSWDRRAAEDYKTFVREYSDHPLVPRALFRMGEVQFRQRNCNTCDLRPVYDALMSYLTILQRYPRSSYDSDARRRIRDCREIIAEHSIRIGRNLFSNEKYESAIMRFREGLAAAREGIKAFPDSGQESEQGAEALYYMGYAYREMKKIKEARETFLLLNNEFPKNLHRMEVEEILNQLNFE